MDGYAATNAIREMEAGDNDGRRIPIVALTAHALPEVRRRCFAVGMDDYLTKPFSLDQLRGCIDHCHEMRAIGVPWSAIPSPVSQSREVRLPLPVEVPDLDPTAVPTAEQTGGNYLSADLYEEELIEATELFGDPDTDAAGESTSEQKGLPYGLVDGGEHIVRFETLESIVSLDPADGGGLLARLIGMYESNSVELLGSIETSFAAKDAIALSKAAHALKSSSGNVGAERLAALCKEIELSARGGELSEIESAIEMLMIEHGMALEKLHEYSSGELA
jgi:two-component system sensor histidine kinase/response regulator